MGLISGFLGAIGDAVANAVDDVRDNANPPITITVMDEDGVTSKTVTRHDWDTYQEAKAIQSQVINGDGKLIFDDEL